MLSVHVGSRHDLWGAHLSHSLIKSRLLFVETIAAIELFL